MIYPESGATTLSKHHEYAVRIMSSILDFVVNSSYFDNYYYFRRNIYFFRNHYLAYFLNYAIYAVKILFKNYNQIISSKPSHAAKENIRNQLRGTIQLL